MKKSYVFMFIALLFAASLYGCGGGGGGGGGNVTPPGSSGNRPTVTVFTMPAAAATLTVPVTEFTTDGAGVTGYLLTESTTPPDASSAGWSATAPGSYSFTSAGSHTLWAYAKNGYGVSAGKSATVVITLESGVLAKAVTGSVKDPVNGDIPAAGAVVKAYRDGSATPLATTTAGSDGSYTLSGLIDGNVYNLVFSRTGYGDVIYYGVTPSQANVLALEPVRLLPTASLSQSAPINGYLRSAGDNHPLAYTTLVFRQGMGATSGDPIAQSTTTDGDGYYARTSFPAGSYTAQVISGSGDTLGYFTVCSVPGFPVYNNSQNCSLVTGGTDCYRAVLSWGNTPQDLDFHLTGPLTPGDTTTTIGLDDTPRFHIDSTQTTYPYDSGVPFSSPTITGTSTESYLDMDQANHGVDNGPETLTILTQRSGPYRFYVYNNSATGTLSASQAVVRLYKGAALLRTFPVPQQSGNTWHVFDLDGSSVTVVNTVSTVAADQTYTLARRVPGSAFDEELLFKPVLKTVKRR